MSNVSTTVQAEEKRAPVGSEGTAQTTEVKAERTDDLKEKDKIKHDDKTPSGKEVGVVKQAYKHNFEVSSLNVLSFGKKTSLRKRTNINYSLKRIGVNDVVVLQELSGAAFQVLLLCNELSKLTGSPWCFVLSDRTGKNYERAAFLYNARKVKLVSSSVLPQDSKFPLIRAPFLGRFKHLESNRIVEVLNVHLSYREAKGNVRNLINGHYRSFMRKTSIQVIAGDFNLAHSDDAFVGLVRSGFEFGIDGTTNLKGDKEYDNIWVKKGTIIARKIDKEARKKQFTKKDYSDHVAISVTLGFNE